MTECVSCRKCSLSPGPWQAFSFPLVLRGARDDLFGLGQMQLQGKPPLLPVPVSCNSSCELSPCNGILYLSHLVSASTKGSGFVSESNLYPLWGYKEDLRH